MDEWALALGVDIDHSKATDRARRKVELQEAGHSTEPGRWTPPVPPPTAPYQSVFGNHPRKRGRDALGGSAGSRHSPVVPEVTALDGFLSDLQRRLKSVEAGAVRSSHNTVVPAPTSSIGSKRGQGTGVARLPKRKTAVTGTGGRLDEATALSSASLVDIYGIPRAFVANAEEARRQWGSHHANLEKRDEEFLDHYKRSARMWGVQVSIAKAWRGFIFRRKFLAWKGRRQWSLKLHFRAWCLASKAARLYSGNLKRSAFSFWSEIVEEDRNTRVMGELSFQAAVSSSRLSRQAVVQFFQDHSSYLDDLSPAVLRNKASVKRRILKILFQSWRNAANLKLKAAAQAAFKMCKAVRLHTASAMLWAPEIVSLLFQVWSRMVLYKKAVREGREPPTFLPENGYASLPEWDAWVANKGRHLEMKRRVIHIGGQIFLRKKFRRWVWFAKWSLSQEDRVLEASQHYDATKVTKVFAAWAGVCRDRGSMLRRITRCWQGWSSFTRTRKKAKVLKKKTVEHLRLLRLGSVMNDITAYARDGQVLSAFTVSKLLLTNKCFGGLALSYIATGRVTQLFALLAWQAWKKYTTKRRRWKWLLYEHTRTEALHSKQAVFKAWSYATGRRYRPDAASLTLSASLPFSTWDRFIKNYVDQGVVPAEQLHKDMVDHSVMQQHTAWWLLGQTGTGDDNITASGPGGGEGGYGRPSGRMELPQSGASGSGGLGKLAFPGFLGGKGPAATDWQALTPALFAAVDECDTAAVIDLLHRGAQVNSIYVPPKVSPTGGIDASRKKATVNKQDERSGPTRGHVLESSRALDLPAPALIANQDGTFEMRGTTPLHAAAAHFSADFTPIVIALLHAGACVDALDAEGRMPVQVCTSPQTVALLSVHAARLQQFRFSTQELRWGQQVLTNSRSGVGRPGLWRYVVRAAVVATLDKLRSKLRVQDARAEDAATEAGRRTQLQQLGFSAMTNGEYTSAADVGFDEREKELIKMKMERLDAAKTIVDREHALHSGTAGPPSTSGGGGGGGAGGSIGVCANDHARGSKRTGKERTAADHRKAFSARRTAAASWFRAFREDLARADMLSPKAESSTSSTSTGSTAGHVSVAEKVLAIVRDAGSENRCSGARAGRGGGKGGGRLNSAVLGGGAAGGSMLGRGGNTSGTDAFTITEANDCYMALGSVLDQRKRVMDERATRDDALIERGYWVGLQRAMEASKRCHSASVALRGTVDNEVLGRAHRTIAAWKEGSEGEGEGSAGRAGPYARLADERGSTFGRGIMSRVPNEWWGQGGGRVLALMLEERRKLRHKGATLTAQAKELEDHLASKSENLQQTADLENILANWDAREIPTASERAKKTKTKSKEKEEVTPETLRRDIDGKRELMMSLSAKEKQSMETIEKAKVQLEEGRVYLLRMQSILTKYASYNMGKMDTLEKEFQECSRQQGITIDRQKVLGTQLQALFKRLAELDKAISILRPPNLTGLLETARRNSATEDSSSLQGEYDPDSQELLPSTSRRGSKRSSSDTEESGSSKRKRRSGGHQQESAEADTREGRDDNSPRSRMKTLSSSSEGMVGSSRLARATHDHREETMASLLILIDENTAIVDADMCSLASSESVSTASGAKKRSRQAKKHKTAISNKPTTATDASTGGAGTATTSSEMKPKPIAIPPSSVEEGEADSLITPAAWPAEPTPGPSGAQQPPSVSGPSVAAAASLTAATVKASSPKRSRRVQRRGYPSPLKKGSRRKKKLTASPRGGKAKAGKRGNPSGSGTAAVGAEAAEQVGLGQPADTDGRVVDAPVSAPGLEEEKRLADMRAAKEAKELAEEEECRRKWDEEDAEELEAWRARRGTEEELEISPKLSKEDTLRLLTGQYDQALKQMFEPERRAVVAKRIAIVEAEQREKERKAQDVRPEERTPEDKLSEGRESNPAGNGFFDEQGLDISHLLDDPGLGLTREEIETLFDIVDEGDTEASNGMVSGGAEGGDGAGGGTTVKRRSRLGGRRADRGLILFLRKRGFRRSSMEPLENPIDAFKDSPRPRPAFKPELDDYMMLNFVGGSSGAEDWNETPSATTIGNTPGAHTAESGDGGDGDQINEDEESFKTEESAVWRGRGNNYDEEILSRDVLNKPEPAKANGDNAPLQDGAHNRLDSADRTTDGDDEAHLYPRTLGTSVSVLDEKDAVLRTGGARFAGEDPIRGRLRATDPFLWMGRLNAGTNAISGLIEKATDALKILDGGSGGSDSDTSDGRSSGHQRVDRMQDIQSSHKEVVGPSSRVRGKSTNERVKKRGEPGEKATTQLMGKLGSMTEGLRERDGTENDLEEGNPGEVDRSCASSENVSSSMAYSQSVEENRVIASGVVIKEKDEDGGEDGEREEYDQGNCSKEIETMGQHKGPGAGSGPCPMRASPVNARSAALGSSAKLRSKDTGMGKAKMAAPVDSSSSSGNGQQTFYNSTEEAKTPTGREDWGEDESQDIRFDDIVSGIVRGVATRAPPTPWQPGEAVVVSRTDVMRPPWSAEERVSPTRRQRSALSGSTQGTGRQIGSAPDRSVTQEEDHSADERPQDNRRCHSASEALLESGLLQEASYLDDAPAATDGVWSWGWHVDGGQEQPSTAATRDTFTPLLTPELCKRAGRLGLRGTSPLRKKGKSGDALSNEKPLNSRAPSLLRHSGNHFPVDGSDARGGGGGTRPWTTGELVNSDSSDGTTTAGTSEFLQRKGGIKRQARSADGVTLSAHPKDSSLRSALEGPDDAVDLLGATADGLVGSAEEGVSKSTSNVLGTIGTDGQGESGGNLEEGVGIDGAAVDDTDGENLEFPGVPSQQMRRRVSFADEQGNSDGSEDSADESDGQNQRRGRRESQRRRMSSFIGSSDGYLEGNGSISGQLVDNDGRRKSDLERCRRAIEITKVAHDLLYLDTRPDGLRPITGTPMNDGRSVQGSGGLYVGLAGLRGFDLSFVGVVPTNPSDARQSLGSVAARLAANRRLSAFAAATIDDESSGAGGGRPSSPRTPIASSSKADASWIAQGFLLDRKPGSLMPSLSPLAKEGSPRTQDARDGREQIGLGGEECARSSPGEGTESEFEGNSEAPPPEVPSGTTAVSCVATAMASLFVPKAAVLWSARDLGVDELVYSAAGDKQVSRPPGSREYTSRALLAAYKKVNPVFEVEASGWSKREGAVAGVDYPLQPPDGWVGANPDFGEGGKDASNVSDSRHGVAETRAAASVTGMGRNAELQATVAPDAGGDQEEVSPAKGDGESPAAGHVVGTVEPHPQVESRENPSGSGNNGKSCSNARRSHDGKGAPSSSRSRDSRERTNRSGGGSPNSQGSGTSRQSSNRGDSKARDSPSPRTRQEIFDKESGSISRKTSHTEEARALEDVSLPRIDKPETITAASGAKQDAWQHRNVAEETYPPAATASPENVFEPQKLPRISSAGGGRSKAAGKHAIKVHSRPARVESKDLQTTTEALTTHHLTVDELLKGGYDELLDDSEDEDDARDRRVTTRKEPLLIPHGARMNGMAYWQRREAKEREQRRRPRSAAHDHTSTGDELGADRASVSGNGNSGGGAEGGNGQWEDEREEIKRLLLAARARREAAVNRVRAQREQARLDSEREILGHIDGSAAVTTTTTPITPAQDGNGSSVGATMAEAPTLANANGRLPAKTFTGAGGPAAAAKSGEATGTVRRAEFFPSTATVGGEVGRRRSDRASGEAPPWKGFTLSVDGEAMLRRGRIPSPERQSPVEGAEDWEYQLIVPGTKDNLVNFSVDTAAVRANYGKLRRRAEIWQRLGLDEEDGDDYASENENENEKEKEKEKENENETKGGHESGNTSTRSASPRHRRNSGAHATGDDAGGNRPNQRRSVFSAERGSFGNPSIDIPEIQIRRRTRVAGQGVRGDESNAAGSTPSNDPGTIAQASRIITELEQNHADLEFPLNALRRDSRGYEDDDYGNEFS
eukprot:g13258.t1